MSDITIAGTGTEQVTLTLSEADMTKAREIARGIAIDDSQSIIQYGVGAQSKISGFADTMLGQIRSHDTGYVGENLTELMFKIKDVKVDSLSPDKPNWLSGILNSVQRFMARYEKLETQIEKIVNGLDDARMKLLRDITMLDQLYGKNLDYLKDLDLYIAAGQIRIDELRATRLPELEAQVKASNDPADTQRLNDFNQFLNRFEKKLYDLKLSRMIAIQTAPQVRLIQNNDQALVEKIQSSILTTIPLWKSQIVIVISLLRQKKAVELQKSVTGRDKRAPDQELRDAQERHGRRRHRDGTRHRRDRDTEEGERGSPVDDRGDHPHTAGRQDQAGPGRGRARQDRGGPQGQADRRPRLTGDTK